MYLERIGSPADLKDLSLEQMTCLAAEMRKALIDTISTTGGHLGSNLGIVELTIAIHHVFDTPRDKVVFDVSHQTACHKMLTGRRDAFLDPEEHGSVSGYSDPEESVYDIFKTGHSSTSISLACGLAKARDMRGGHEDIIAVIGDASLDGGQSFEALNYGAEMDTGLIVMINDNDMSIAENHGYIHTHLARLRENDGRGGDNYFRALGYDYRFVRDGNDISQVVEALKAVKGTDHPVVVHVCTQKGKGFGPAEKDMEKWHWAKPFDKETGEFRNTVARAGYASLTADFLLGKMARDPGLVVVTSASPSCIGFNRANREKAGGQFLDVGICEQNAVSFTAALARGGCKAVYATNSTFIQRAYDQIEQEMCLGKCPMTLIVTHGSVYGHWNDVQNGLLDIALLGNIPNLVYLAPANRQEYLAMLDWSIGQDRLPVAIRMPGTPMTDADGRVDTDYSETAYEVKQKGSRVAVLALGGFFRLGEETVRLYEEKTGERATLVNPRFITGCDSRTLEELKKEHGIVVTIEDGILSGGFGGKIAGYYADSSMRVLSYGFSQEIPVRYEPPWLMERNRLTPACIVGDILDHIRASWYFPIQ